MKPEIKAFRERIRHMDPIQIREMIAEMNERTAELLEKMQVLHETVRARMADADQTDPPDEPPEIDRPN